MTDLIDEIARVFDEHWVDHETHDTVAAAKDVKELIIARIPPLVWMGGGGWPHAGNYVIEDVSVGQREIRRLLCASFGTTYLSDFAGDKPLEAAKAAANAHHVAQLCKGMGIE